MGRYMFNNQSLIPSFGLGENAASKQLSQFGTLFFISEHAVLDGALYYQIDKFKIIYLLIIY
ncbi:hypothetical protein [Flavivirga aquatica]|uniref:hypothetical protein n=1 Tax=Flavivirga aquatica TaxID=1849968 RepID=UPI000F4D86A9|nr:hypothetical protein [Flavivirga aquatica]